MDKLIIALPNRYAVCVASDSASVLKALRQDYAPHCREACAEDCVIPTLFLTEQNGEFVATEGDISRAAPFPFQEVSDFISRQLAADQSLFLLHGSAVAHMAEGHLFLAVSGSGKTTLAAYLCEAGFPYIAEDCIYLDRESLCALPYYRPIHLREGGLDVLQGLGLHPDAVWDPMLKRYILHPQAYCESPILIRHIHFIQRSETENRVTPLSAPERIAQLLHAPRVTYPMNRDYLSFIMRLARVDCDELLFHDLDFVKTILQR